MGRPEGKPSQKSVPAKSTTSAAQRPNSNLSASRPQQDSQKAVPAKSTTSAVERPHSNLSSRRPQQDSQKAVPAKSTTSAVERPHSNLSSRRPQQDSQKAVPAKSTTSAVERPHSNLSSRRPQQDSQKAVPTKSTTSAVERPHSNLSPRRPQDKELEKAHPCGKSQSQGKNPTRSAESSEDSSYAGRRGATAKQYTPTITESGAPVLNVPKRQATKTSVHFHQDHLSQRDIDKIEQQTRGQRENQEWYNWRQNRITASLAHQVSHSKFANQKTNDIPQSYLKSILGSAPSVQTAAMNWGIRNEKKAVQAYERLASVSKGSEVQVETCGLFIHPTKNWVAASPDGLVKDRHTGETLNILEVKCPFKHREHTVREACKDRDFCLDLNGDSYTLKRQHTYYTQVQCQMAVTGISNADFVVHTNKETAVIPVKFDPEFWKDTELKLERFYTEAVLPNVKQRGTYKEEVRNNDVYTPEE